MVHEFKLPDVGEGLTEAEIVSWLVAEGDTVSEDQPVAEVETDKAVVEVPSPVNGTVHEILADAGEIVPVGDVIITFDIDEEQSSSGQSSTGDSDDEPVDPSGATGEETDPATERAETDTEESTSDSRIFAAPSVRQLARELDVDIESVDGSGPSGRVTDRDVRAGAADAGDETHPEPSATTSESREPVVETASAAADRDRTAARPSTRGLARDLDVDIDAVPTEAEHKGQAFVTTEQVRRFAAAEERQSAPTDAVAGPEERVERVPYRGLRRTIGERMATSKFTVPHVTAHHHPDVSDLVEVREELAIDAEKQGVRLTYLPFVLKATVSALQSFPMFNAELDEAAEEIIHKRYYHVGVATATEDGLLVPVVENVDQKGILDLAREVNDLAKRARERDLSPSELSGGTFTISNYGAIGGNFATPIINYPETAILGLGELKQRPRVHDAEVVPRHTLPLSVSFDHRVADGLDGGRFATHLIERLEDPYRLLL
jgi:pyruvate dehydrogenase E2 component (dihydrolipoamide acetyltransferase)